MMYLSEKLLKKLYPDVQKNKTVGL